MTDQTKRAICDEINILLQVKGSNKRRSTGDSKAVRAFKLGGLEDEKCYGDFFPFKVWNILTPDSQVSLRRVNSIKIVLVKDNAVNTG